jgi:hypothetical protein
MATLSRSIYSLRVFHKYGCSSRLPRLSRSKGYFSTSRIMATATTTETATKTVPLVAKEIPNGAPVVNGDHQAEETPASAPETLVPIAKKILELAQKLESGILKPPSFQEDTLANLPSDLEKVRKSLIDESGTFNALVRGAGGPFGRIQTVSGTYVRT